MNQNFTKFAFTDSVKQAQKHYGTRRAYARMEKAGDHYRLTDTESAFIQSRDSFYLCTIGENGWPYVQFRGGPNGFLKVIDETTLGYADFRGNGQYISTGILQSCNKAALILMDYPSRQRLKIWAETIIIEAKENMELTRQLEMPDYKARIERIVRFSVLAYDWNCPQHIWISSRPGVLSSPHQQVAYTTAILSLLLLLQSLAKWGETIYAGWLRHH